MKNLTTRLSRLLLVVALILPWSAANAFEEFKKSGLIKKVNFSSLVVDGQEFKLAVGAKVRMPDNRAIKLSQLKAGDAVLIKGRKVSGVYYADLVLFRIYEDD